jgi:hypothetical protein
MRIALVIALAGLAAACAREPEPVVLPEPAPVTAEPVFSGKL